MPYGFSPTAVWFLMLWLLLCGPGLAIDYPIAYVRVPRDPDPKVQERWNQAHLDTMFERGSDLVLRNPDGSERVLVDVEDDAVADPMVSLDGNWIYYALVYDIPVNPGNWSAMENFGTGSDIYKVHVRTGDIVRLTRQESELNTGIVKRRVSTSWAEGTGWNLSPCPVAGGKVVFTSTRCNFTRRGGNKYHSAFQLYCMDEDGANCEKVGHLNLGTAAHPVRLVDGRIMWSTQESQGSKDFRNWSLWASKPDGRTWEPLFSSFGKSSPTTLHRQAQASDGSIIVERYYNATTAGSLWRFPLTLPDPQASVFGDPDYRKSTTGYFRYERIGLNRLTPWGEDGDDAAADARVGYPSPAPDNGLLVTLLPGPAFPKHYPDVKVYGLVGLIRDVAAPPPKSSAEHVERLVELDDCNAIQPVAVVPFERIYGEAMKELPFLPNDGTEHPMLPAGTPFGLIGTSSFYAREDSVDDVPDWDGFGAVSGKPWTNADIYAVRIVAQEPTSRALGSSPDSIHFRVHGGERLRVLGEVPLRKTGTDGKPLLDRAGDPDTSFLARIPADTPFTFQTLDRDGRVLNMAQTWHQLRPGEVRHDCRGCHAHHEPGIPFEGTAASKPDYEIADFTKPASAAAYEFWTDVLPILERRCASCHSAEAPGGFDVAKYRPTVWGMPAEFATPYRSRESKLSMAVMGELLGHQQLPEDERRIVNVWIDLGAGTNLDERTYHEFRRKNWRASGIKTDDQRPTLWVSRSEMAFGAYDYETGLDRVKVTGRGGADLTGSFTMTENVWRSSLPADGEVTFEAWDRQGNVARIVRVFRNAAAIYEPLRQVSQPRALRSIRKTSP
jgi:hypothetical protein